MKRNVRFLAIGGLLVLATVLVGERLMPRNSPWTVFKPATSNLSMSPNLLVNLGFESSSQGQAESWAGHFAGYTIDEGGGLGGGRALRLTNEIADDAHGAYQQIVLNQSKLAPLYFSAWSRAAGLTGEADSDYSLYLDLLYADGTSLYGQVLEFEPGTHDWQFREGFIRPEKPVQSVGVNALLRGSHAGTVWFDDLAVKVIDAEVLPFDGVLADTEVTRPSSFEGSPLELSTADGLKLDLSPTGGAVTGLSIEGRPINNPDYAYASGFFVRDAARQSQFVHMGGTLSKAENTVTHSGEITSLGLSFTGRYTADADRITIHGEISDTSGSDRALTLYFALPVNAHGWDWGDDVRASRKVGGYEELANFGWPNDLGATGYQSKYPWASLSGPAGGLALAVPLGDPRIFRLVYNPVSNQFYAAFDLGLSPLTSEFPSKAWVDLVIYRFDPAWGFRAAAQGYYDRFEGAFIRRTPPGQEGIWVAFSDLSRIDDLADFGIAFHEVIDLQQVGFDHKAGISTFRYLSEPWSSWFPLDDARASPNNYDNLVSYLEDRLRNGTASERRQVESTLSSAVFDETGRFVYDTETKPWCNGTRGCALFVVNPDPDIVDNSYPLNKAHLEWNDQARAAYETAPGLAGEYLDSLETWASTLDFRADHFAAVDAPLTYRTTDRRLGIAESFAITKFARWVAEEVHGIGKWTMGNGVRDNLPWGSDLFDVGGVEVDWLKSGRFVPDTDGVMNYRRTLSYQRPYGLLMNTDFDEMSREVVERYFQIALFYGIYPSMFSRDSATAPYWDDPRLYNRDRPLFRRYIPIIRSINLAGWQPVTYARASEHGVFIERFGTWPDLYFTLRNTLDVPVTVSVTMEAQPLKLTGTSLNASAQLTQKKYQLGEAGPLRSVTLPLAAQATEVLKLGP